MPVQTVHIKLVKGRCRIKPSKVIVHRGGTVEFDKKVSGPVYVQVYDIGRSFSIKKKAKKGSFKVAKSTKPGVHPYAVFCYDEKAFCTGSSMPIIIVPR